jgi:RimJ/RimL family protein N-acetyltransferase
MMETPMLQGKRVLLRSITRADLPRLCEFNNDLEVELASGGDPPFPQSLDRLQAEYDQNIARGGRDGTDFAIEADGKLIGQCALFNLNSTAQVCELGITIGDKAYWGQGYGRESISLLVEYAFRYLNYRKVWLQVHATNQRAIRAYLASGFVEEGRLRAHLWSNGSYDDLVLMSQFREDWQKQRSG